MVVLTYVFGSSDPWFVIFNLISVLCLVLCCDIYRSTLILIMYPACMITVHDRKSRALQLLSFLRFLHRTYDQARQKIQGGRMGTWLINRGCSTEVVHSILRVYPQGNTSGETAKGMGNF